MKVKFIVKCDTMKDASLMDYYIQQGILNSRNEDVEDITGMTPKEIGQIDVSYLVKERGTLKYRLSQLRQKLKK